MINLTTGPVGILPCVTEALMQAPISHRSAAFAGLYSTVTTTLCALLHVKQTFVLTGSGTLANEAMIAQIALRRQHGLIISNGEFGNRLIKQAQRHELDFEVLHTTEGVQLRLEKIAAIIAEGKVKWLLLCHCESSTGVINPLHEITDLCQTYDCAVYADFMSTFGNMPLDLRNVAMATASSGKGAGAYAGLALVFCNVPLQTSNTTAVYLDLCAMQDCGGIPFTISSNLLLALHVAIQQNLNKERWQLLDAFSATIYNNLNSLQLIPYSSCGNRVFTIIPANGDAQKIAAHMLDRGIELSCHSDYLIRKNQLQLALFGNYTAAEIAYVAECFNHFIPALQDLH